MKKLLSIIVICLGFCLQSQAQTKQRSPKIVAQLKVGQSYTVGSQSLKFVRVSSDSRCPEGVTCVWQGEVKIMVAIYSNKKEVSETKVLNISPGKESPFVAEIEGKVFQVFSVSPYPKKGEAIATDEYRLNLIVTDVKEDGASGK